MRFETFDIQYTVFVSWHKINVSSYQNVEFRTMGSDNNMKLENNIKFKIVPPFKTKTCEIEPYLALITKVQEETLCQIDEICNISVTTLSPEEEDLAQYKHKILNAQKKSNKEITWVKPKEKFQIEIARKNGIPLYLTLKDEITAMSFLSTICGYYRYNYIFE